MQEDSITDKIIFEFDMIRILSNLSIYAIKNDSEEIENDSRTYW